MNAFDIPALGRNAQLWIGTERPDDNVVVSRPRPQTIFLRALSHSLDSSSPAGAERLMVAAMDELDRALLNPLVTGQKKLDTPYSALPRGPMMPHPLACLE